MEFEEFSGKSVDEALTQAAIKLGTTSDNIDYEVIDAGSNGVLGIGRRMAKINAKIKEEGEATASDKKVVEASANENKVNESETAKTVKNDNNVSENVDVIAVADKFLEKVFKAMNMEVKVDIKMSEADRNMDIELSGEEMGILIGKRGQTIDSLQYLVSLVVNKESKEYIRVKVDTENYRERRKATLEELAKNIAYKVKRTKRPVSLEPMNPYERRIIHSALQDDKYVTTKSEGEEPYRHVIVLLKK